MLWPFKRKEIDTEVIVYERWKTNFGFFKTDRFFHENNQKYSSQIKNKALVLQIKKRNIFSWIIDKYFQYRDFYIQAAAGFAPENGNSALGFIFRYINDENFYYFLISNQGMFRLDCVFNGTPIHLIEWTECPLINDSQNKIKIIVHGTHFSFYLDDEWIGEIQDETIGQGKIGFAAQNYNEKPEARFLLHDFLIESRELEVEREYFRWVRHIPANPDYRKNLAQTYFLSGKYSYAAIQFKKAFKLKPGTADECFQYGECLLNLRVYDQALDYMEKTLQLKPDEKKAKLEKANLLYLLNLSLEARDYINKIIHDFQDNSVLWNLLGNAEYSLGNWQQAYEVYKRAYEIDNNMALFSLNAARALERLNKKKQALEYYLKASRILLRQEAYDDFSLILPRILELDPQNMEVQAARGKMLFHGESIDQAEKIFKKLIESEYKDSAVHYLLALILIQKGERKQALTQLEKATELESDFAAYWFKLAENKYILEQDPKREIEQAYKLNPNDVWINNLFGLYHMNKHKYKQAEEYLGRAYETAQQELDIIINYTDLLLKRRNKKKAFSIIEKALKQMGDDAKLFNHRANLFVKAGDYANAVADYEKALKLEPDNPLYMENCAASCIEIDMIMRAEEILVKLVDMVSSASVYNLLGNVAVIKGEFRRAEMAYEEGLKLDKNNQDILINLSSLFYERNNYQNAKEYILLALDFDAESKRAKKILKKIQKRFELKLHCSLCKREWWVPKDIPPQFGGKIFAQPPPESPAGKCGKCGKIYCIACVSDYLKDKRFVCPNCDEYLKLADEHLHYLVHKFLKQK